MRGIMELQRRPEKVVRQRKSKKKSKDVLRNCGEGRFDL